MLPSVSGLLSVRHDAVLEMRLDRPDKLNAITGAMYEGLIAALALADSDPGIRAVLLSATPPVFSAGNDIREFLAMTDMEQAPAARFVRAIATCDTPLVAAVCGPAIGVGTTMLLHCDLVYAAPAATFGVPFVDLGLVPEAGSSLLLPLRTGRARASALLLLGETIGADDAVAAGIVNAVVPADAVQGHALAVAQRLAQKPPQALAATRRLMRQGQEALLAQMDAEQAEFGAALRGPEARAAFAAFLRPRSPV